MNIKEFLKELEKFKENFSENAKAYYKMLVEKQDEIDKPNFTENGLKIIKIMKENQEKYLNVFSAKQVGELLFMSPRSVSGSMKKLINDNYVEKKTGNPITYSLTDLGKSVEIDNE